MSFEGPSDAIPRVSAYICDKMTAFGPATKGYCFLPAHMCNLRELIGSTGLV
jgi:hypothetical protein